MAYAWFVCPYKNRVWHGETQERRIYCAMGDFTEQIRADGGDWAETRVLGIVAVAKVRASDATLALINATAGFIRITNHFVLSDDLSDLTTIQYNVIQNKLLLMGYSQAEIDAAMGGSLTEWRTHTFEDLLNLIASRRLKLAFNSGIIETTEPIIPTSISIVNGKVK